MFTSSLVLLSSAWLAVAAPTETGFIRKQYVAEDGSKGPYMLFVPHSYDGEQPVPVILFLHGSGEVRGGDTGQRPVDVGIGTYIREHEKRFPYLTIFPRAATGPWGGKQPDGQMAMSILDKTLDDYKCNRSRIILTGLSMGGGGTWNLAAAHPKRWAAIVPICGRGHINYAPAIKDIPCWVFHGAADDQCPVSESRQMVAALKQAGGNPRYTEYPKVGHVSWDRAYAEPELWSWLREQRKN